MVSFAKHNGRELYRELVLQYGNGGETSFCYQHRVHDISHVVPVHEVQCTTYAITISEQNMQSKLG